MEAFWLLMRNARAHPRTSCAEGPKNLPHLPHLPPPLAAQRLTVWKVVEGCGRWCVLWIFALQHALAGPCNARHDGMDYPTPPDYLQPWHRRLIREVAAGRPVLAVAAEIERTPTACYTTLRRNREYLNALIDYIDRTFVDNYTSARSILAVESARAHGPRSSRSLGSISKAHKRRTVSHAQDAGPEALSPAPSLPAGPGEIPDSGDRSGEA